MRSDYTPNGRHKDDPTNPESHWNDWSIDRDGNKLEGYGFNYKKIEKEIEIDNINDDFKNLILKMSVAMLTIEKEQEKINVLSGFCKSLIEVVEKQDKIIRKLRKK